MSIYELATLLSTDLIIKYMTAWDSSKWMCKLDRVEIKESKRHAILSSEYGRGGTPEEAIRDYVDKIQGKHLVYRAGMGPQHRKELSIPSTLEVIE